ncbi:MAG TPA: PQQ-binding-like beta-propeller repeat protein [Bryobacteraceae bacterium]|nr:PQQ-binding-like beta-propeller repeat protein [Bryobacteraceae bacterium]
MKHHLYLLAVALLPAVFAQPQPAERRVPLQGPAARMAAQPLFNNNCAGCHKNTMSSADQNTLKETNAPTTDTLAQMTPEAIYAALTTGAMVQQAAKLNNDEKRVIAEFFGGRPLGMVNAGDAGHMTNHCTANPQMSDPAKAPSWSGWGNDLANTRYQPASVARLTAEQTPRLKLKWAFGLSNGAETYGQPVIAAGRLFIGDDNSYVYALNAETGCVYWSFQAEAQVRTAIAIAPVIGKGNAKYAAYFGDRKANVYALDAHNGELLWKTNVDRRVLSHITGSPVAYGGRVYVGVAGSEEVASGDPHYPCCTYRGSLSALDAATGKVIWKSYTIPEEPKPTKKNSLGTQLWAPAGASIWSAPTIDTKARAIYASTGNAFTEPAAKTSDGIVAFDMATGKILWSYQGVENDASPQGCGGRGPKGEQCPEHPGPDWDFANSPILRTLAGGKRVLVAAHKGGTAVAIDPDRKGELLWKADLTDSAVAGPGGQIMWGGAADEQNVYYDLQTGAVAALKLADGSKAWLTHVDPHVDPADPSAGGGPARRPRKGLTAAVTVIPGVVFAGGWDGVLHAFAAADGHQLWQFNTAQEFQTVNGVAGKGGSLGDPGPVIVGGNLYVGSGYIGTGNGMPGNVLLAFSSVE